MGNDISQRITIKIRAVDERLHNDRQLSKEVEQSITATKSNIHRLELQLIEQSTASDRSTHSSAVFIESMRTLGKQRASLKSLENQRIQLAQQMKHAAEDIEHYRYWLGYAETDDVAKQLEAEKHVF